jgi:hypothetical protein
MAFHLALHINVHDISRTWYHRKKPHVKFPADFSQKGKTFWLTEAKGRAILLSTDTLTLLFIDWFPGAPADPKGRSGKCFSP